MKKIPLVILFVFACDTLDKEMFPEPGIYVKTKDNKYFTSDCTGIGYEEFCQDTHGPIPHYTEEQCEEDVDGGYWYERKSFERMILYDDLTGVSITERCRSDMNQHLDGNDQIDCENNGGNWTSSVSYFNWQISTITSPLTISMFFTNEDGEGVEMRAEYDINTASIHYIMSNDISTKCIIIHEYYSEHLRDVTENECISMNGIWQSGECTEIIFTKN